MLKKVFIGWTVMMLPLGAAANQSPFASSYNFRVMLDDKPIGYHQFELSRSDTVREVSSEAKFDVKLLFITAFKYRHSSSERWQNDCLTEIDAQTNSNGKRLVVSGERVDDVLRIDSTNGTRRVDGCVQTFAYWNPSILDASRLLNSQTGDYVDVEVTPLGTDQLSLDGSAFEARKYKLRSAPEYQGKPVDITLWYEADSMQWLALESLADGGRTIRYERTDAVAPTGSSLSASSSNASASR